VNVKTSVGSSLGRRDFLIGGTLLGLAAGAGARSGWAAEKKGAARLRLGIVTDVHFETAFELGLNQQMFRRALEEFKETKVDAVALPGDLIDRWTLAEFRAAMDVWVSVFGSPAEHGDGHVELVFATGNHEINARPDNIPKHPEWFCHPDNLSRTWREYFGEDYTEGVFLKRVKGFSFVCANWGHAKAEEIRPLIEEVARTTKRGDPIFFLSHMPPVNTCYGSYRDRANEDGTEGAVYDAAFKGHENVVAITGHTHKANAHPRSIWQDRYTCLNAGSLTWTEFAGWMYPQGLFPETHNCKDAMLLTVYDDEIVVARHNVVHGFATGPDWRLPLPLERKTFPYTLERMRARAGEPRFPAGARPQVSLALAERTLHERFPINSDANRVVGRDSKSVQSSGGTLVSFPAAEPVGEEDLVRAYDVTACGKDGAVVAAKRVNTRFFFGASGMERFYQCYFDDTELPRTGTYDFSVKAVTCLGFSSTLRGCEVAELRSCGVFDSITTIIQP